MPNAVPIAAPVLRPPPPPPPPPLLSDTLWHQTICDAGVQLATARHGNMCLPRQGPSGHAAATAEHA